MSNELMIPSKAEVPAYLMNSAAARQANEEAVAGISAGFPPRLKTNGKGSFAVTDRDGVDKIIPPAKMFAGEDGNLYLPVIVLRAKIPFDKKWYATAYNKDDGKAPDCFSHDGVKPDISVLVPQSPTCANCPHNAFGSAKDQAGNPTKGKACSDSKILAVYLAEFGVVQFGVTPGALKYWRAYVDQLNANGIPMYGARTLIGFVPSESSPITEFKFGGFLPEANIPKIEALRESDEANEIVVPNAAPALTAPAVKEALPPVEPKVEAPPAKKPEPPKVEPEVVKADDLGLGVDIDVPPAVEKKAPVAPAAKNQLTDDELARELGL